jgi:thiol:disulfide interchange protein DsbD
MTRQTVSIYQYLLLLILTIAAITGWAQDDELLEPDQAFALQTPEVRQDAIVLTWTIAPDYYLYQNKFKFELEGANSDLGKPELSPAIRKHDEFFGDVDIYKHTVTATLPLRRTGTDAQDVELRTVVQGCNEPVGVCYPPIRRTVTLSLPAVSSVSAAEPAEPIPGGSPPTSASGLDALLDPAEEDEFLPPDEAFLFSAAATSVDTVHVSIIIADKYYLYRSKFSFESATDGVTLLPYTLPAGEVKQDQFLGRQEVYHHQFDIDLKLADPSTSGPFDLVARYQGCAERGICYPPITKTVNLSLPGGTVPAPESVDMTVAPTAQTPVTTETAPAVSEEEGIIAILSAGNLWATMAAFFVFGLALSLTPCVFPMIPILSGIIVGQGTEVTRSRAFMLSVVYVLGMAVMYTSAGILAAMTGELLSSAFQNPWVLGAFSLVFVLLALSMFGFYDLQLPTSLQSKLSETSHQLRGGAYGGVFIMGMLSALIVGPCVAAPLSGALLYIGQTGDMLLGGTALFVMSLGMGVPLLLIGASAGALLPRAGVWMDAVKAVFGVLLLAVAIWLMERVLPAPVTLLLWALLLIVSAAFMHAFDSLPEHSSGWRRLWKGLGLAMTLYGAALLFGALTGASDPLNPLEKITAPTGSAAVMTDGAQTGLAFTDVKGETALQTALQRASAAGNPVLIDFYADWCVECVRMENTTFKSTAVQQALAGFTLLRLDVTANDDADKDVLKRFKLFGPPALLIFAPDGRELRSLRVVGYQDSETFRATIQQAIKNWPGQ